MQVRQVMKKTLVAIQPTSTILEATKQMKEHNVGSVLVMEESGKLKGILTDRDIALALGSDGIDPKTTCACDIMTQDPITIDADADIDSALRIMHRANIRRLPVMENGKVVGLLSSADAACALKEQINEFLALEEAFVRH